MTSELTPVFTVQEHKQADGQTLYAVSLNTSLTEKQRAALRELVCDEPILPAYLAARMTHAQKVAALQAMPKSTQVQPTADERKAAREAAQKLVAAKR